MPQPGLDGVLRVEALYQYASVMARILAGQLYERSGERLLDPCLVGFWTEHAERNKVNRMAAAMGIRGSSLAPCMMSDTLTNRRPSWPPGCRNRKSAVENPIRSSRATAIASPKASITVVEVVGASVSGQASLLLGTIRLTSAA